MTLITVVLVENQPCVPFVGQPAEFDSEKRYEPRHSNKHRPKIRPKTAGFVLRNYNNFRTDKAEKSLGEYVTFVFFVFEQMDGSFF